MNIFHENFQKFFEISRGNFCVSKKISNKFSNKFSKYYDNGYKKCSSNNYGRKPPTAD